MRYLTIAIEFPQEHYEFIDTYIVYYNLTYSFSHSVFYLGIVVWSVGFTSGVQGDEHIQSLLMWQQ